MYVKYTNGVQYLVDPRNFFFSNINIPRLQDDVNDMQKVSWCIRLLISCLKSLKEKIWCDFKTM